MKPIACFVPLHSYSPTPHTKACKTLHAYIECPEGLLVEIQPSPCEVDACCYHASVKHGLQHLHGVAAGSQGACQLGAYIQMPRSATCNSSSSSGRKGDVTIRSCCGKGAYSSYVLLVSTKTRPTRQAVTCIAAVCSSAL